MNFERIIFADNIEVICEIYSLFTINTNKLNDLLSLDLGWEVLRTVTLEGGRYINITYYLDFEWLTLSPKNLESSFLHCLPYTLSQDSPGNLVFKSQALMTNQHCEENLHCSKKIHLNLFRFIQLLYLYGYSYFWQNNSKLIQAPTLKKPLHIKFILTRYIIM